MGQKNKVKIKLEDVPESGALKLSGADIEGVVNRAYRLSLLSGASAVGAEHLQTALTDFIPSAEDAEKRLQELAAILECTELPMLPEAVRQQMRSPAGKAELLRRFELLKAQLE
jgi:hypothetical protein